jgi:hypothetical protein
VGLLIVHDDDVEAGFPAEGSDPVDSGVVVAYSTTDRTHGGIWIRRHIHGQEDTLADRR